MSLDNVVAGTSLGLLGDSLWLAPVVFGVTTAVWPSRAYGSDEPPRASSASAPIC